jgi:hypothetical protein
MFIVTLSVQRILKQTLFCEQMHQTIGNSLRVSSALHPRAGMQDASLQLVDASIANAVHHATRAAFHSSLKITPGALLAFGRDMVPDTPLIADLRLIQEE